MRSFEAPGTFVVGCNYWASHAGTAMWRDWRPQVIEHDLTRLAAEGVQVLRVFPLWPDFQPLTRLWTAGVTPVEFRFGEEPLPADEFGQAGVDAVAMRHFAEFADAADRHGLKLLVGLITGWMSGRLFMPPGLEGRNPITDAGVIQWELRFVHCFVNHFKAHPAIVGWDLGNECNCMAPASREAAWTWTAGIVSTIRAADPTRPVVSGMHSLHLRPDGAWNIHDQAELTDILTTHPYPYFTPYCDQDPIHTLRPALHATAESCFYADLGMKPCMVEEIGTLGNMFGSEEVAARFLETVLFSSWAHDCRGLLWWCGFDQTHLAHAPYDWHTFERELGLLRLDHSAKPVVKTLGQFGKFVAGLPFPALPPRVTDAVCLLSADQDQWQIAFSTFILAKQAGFDIRFCDETQPLPKAQLYLVPGLRGGRFVSRHAWLDLLERVRGGAQLYLSHHDAIIADFEALTGLRVLSREKRSGPATLELDLVTPGLRIETSAPVRLELQATRAQVLGHEPDGNPAFTAAAFGRGKVFFLSAPIEAELMSRPGAFHGPGASPFWRVYQFLKSQIKPNRVISRDSPKIAVTEHPLTADRRVIALINHDTVRQRVEFAVAPGWALGDVLHGSAPSVVTGAQMDCQMPGNSAAVFVVAKTTARRRGKAR